MTWQEALHWAAAALAAGAVPAPQAEARWLLQHVSGATAATMLAKAADPLPAAWESALREAVRRRASGEPFAYVVGEREFYGRPFVVTPAVLIPRPETETLVDAALECLPPAARGVVVDFGTGSGCLAVTLALERPQLRVLAVDISPAALSVAAVNVQRHGVGDRVQLVQGDYWAALAEYQALRGAVTAVVSNPPYVLQGDARLAPDVAAWEPALALYAPAGDALGAYRAILSAMPAWLEPGAATFCAFETAPWLAVSLAASVAAQGFRTVQQRADAAGQPRVVWGRGWQR